ncbi:MAG: DUF2934 domain-containing protein [Chthoniobacterales bacterium]
MPTNAKETDKSKAPAEETALNGDAAQPAAKKARSPRKKPASRKTSAPKRAAPPISDEAIRTRAYFIAEQRERMSLPGDADSDWLEARRQLLAELGES